MVGFDPLSSWGKRPPVPRNDAHASPKVPTTTRASLPHASVIAGSDLAPDVASGNDSRKASWNAPVGVPGTDPLLHAVTASATLPAASNGTVARNDLAPAGPIESGNAGLRKHVEEIEEENGAHSGHNDSFNARQTKEERDVTRLHPDAACRDVLSASIERQGESRGPNVIFFTRDWGGIGNEGDERRREDLLADAVEESRLLVDNDTLFSTAKAHVHQSESNEVHQTFARGVVKGDDKRNDKGVDQGIDKRVKESRGGRGMKGLKSSSFGAYASQFSGVTNLSQVKYIKSTFDGALNKLTTQISKALAPNKSHFEERVDRIAVDRSATSSQPKRGRALATAHTSRVDVLKRLLDRHPFNVGSLPSETCDLFSNKLEVAGASDTTVNVVGEERSGLHRLWDGEKVLSTFDCATLIVNVKLLNVSRSDAGGDTSQELEGVGAKVATPQDRLLKAEATAFRHCGVGEGIMNGDAQNELNSDLCRPNISPGVNWGVADPRYAQLTGRLEITNFRLLLTPSFPAIPPSLEGRRHKDSDESADIISGRDTACWETSSDSSSELSSSAFKAAAQYFARTSLLALPLDLVTEPRIQPDTFTLVMTAASTEPLATQFFLDFKLRDSALLLSYFFRFSDHNLAGSHSRLLHQDSQRPPLPAPAFPMFAGLPEPVASHQGGNDSRGDFRAETPFLLDSQPEQLRGFLRRLEALAQYLLEAPLLSAMFRRKWAPDLQGKTTCESATEARYDNCDTIYNVRLQPDAYLLMNGSTLLSADTKTVDTDIVNTNPLHRAEVDQQPLALPKYCLFDPLDEYGNFPGFDIETDFVDNSDYSLSPSYPAEIPFPPARFMTRPQIESVAAFRGRGRFPVLSWRSLDASLWRCSQPRSALARNADDEQLICNYLHTLSPPLISQTSLTGRPQSSRSDVVIFDARPFVNAMACKLKGAGYENVTACYRGCKIDFASIENIHKVSEAARLMERAIHHAHHDAEFYFSRVRHGTRHQDQFVDHFAEQAEYNASEMKTSLACEIYGSRWLTHVASILRCAVRIVRHIVEGESVVVHCSDGWDRTSQLTALSCLMLDSRYRTLKGFLILTEKEFLWMGHQCRTRLHCNHSSERAPIFLQWLECVHNIYEAHPQAFGFTADLLLLLALKSPLQASHSDWLADSDRLRSSISVKQTQTRPRGDSRSHTGSHTGSHTESHTESYTKSHKESHTESHKESHPHSHAHSHTQSHDSQAPRLFAYIWENRHRWQKEIGYRENVLDYKYDPYHLRYWSDYWLRFHPA